MAAVQITWRGIRPIGPHELAFDVQWALDNDYPVHVWPDTNASGDLVTLIRVTSPSGNALALYESSRPADAPRTT